MIQSGYVCVGGGGACVGVGSEGDNPGVLWVIQGVLIRRCNPSRGTSLVIITSLCKQNKHSIIGNIKHSSCKLICANSFPFHDSVQLLFVQT